MRSYIFLTVAKDVILKWLIVVISCHYLRDKSAPKLQPTSSGGVFQLKFLETGKMCFMSSNPLGFCLRWYLRYQPKPNFNFNPHHLSSTKLTNKRANNPSPNPNHSLNNVTQILFPELRECESKNFQIGAVAVLLPRPGHVCVASRKNLRWPHLPFNQTKQQNCAYF